MYRENIVASFIYDLFDPLAQTIIKVLPGAGGEMTFALDFAAITLRIIGMSKRLLDAT